MQRHAEAAGLRENVEVLHSVGITEKKAFRISEEKVNGVKALIVYYRKSSLKPVNFFRRMWAYRIGFQRVNRPDVIHANVLYNNLLFVVWLKWFEKIPFVVTEHWTALQRENHPRLSFLQKKLSQFIGNQANKIMPVSDNLKQSLQELGIKTPMKVVPNVVNTEVFTIDDSVKSSTTKFLHISNLIPRKNPDKIINAVLRLKNEGFDVNLEIGGDGDLSEIQRLIKENQANEFVKTFGPLTLKEVAEKIQQADCFLLFSNNETQGCVLLESFACGKPVISTAVGGVPEIVKEGFGKLISKADEQALYAAMKDFCEGAFPLKNQQEMREFVVETFSPEKIAAQFSEIYEEVLG